MAPVSVGKSFRSELVSEKNYSVGVSRTVFVGENVVRIKDYAVRRQDFVAMKAEQPITLQGGPVRIDLTTGQHLPVVGQRTVNGVSYHIAAYGDFGLHVGPNGELHNRVLNGVAKEPRARTYILAEVIFTFDITPAGSKLLPVTATTVDKDAYKQNFEIVFNGSDGQAMRFQYREYAPEDLARPAFSEDLSYPLTAKTLRFRNLIISVEAVDAEKITYTVTGE